MSADIRFKPWPFAARKTTPAEDKNVGCVQPDPTTVENMLEQRIRHLGEEIHRAIQLRRSLPRQVLQMPAYSVRELSQFM